MQIIHELAVGFNEAPNGTAAIIKRGTSTPASYFNDFEGFSPVAAGTTVQLSSTGSAIVFVNEYVLIEVRDLSGTLKAQFVPGDSSPNTEVRSLSFDGADYASGAIAPNSPTTLQSVLDLVIASFGTTNWQVLFQGASVNLQDALSGLGGVFFNVQDNTFGATGDGTTDDTAAIQATVDAAAVTGGIAYFPGTANSYRTTSVLTLPANVSMMGVGSQGSQIILDSATADLLEFTVDPANVYESQFVSGFRLAHAQSNTGVTINLKSTNPVLIDNCYVGGSIANPSSRLVGVASGTTSPAGTYTYRRCTFEVGGDFVFHSDESAPTATIFEVCRFIAPIGSRATAVSIGNNEIHFIHCTFDLNLLTTGTFTVLDLTTFTVIVAAVTGCRFRAAPGPVVTVFDTPELSTFFFSESANTFFSFGAGDRLYNLNYDNTAPPLSLRQSFVSRDGAIEVVGTTIPTSAAAADQYGSGLITISGTPGTIQTVTLTAGFTGNKFSLIIRNNTALTITQLIINDSVTGASVLDYDEGKTIASGEFAAFTFLYVHYSISNSSWAMTGDVTT